MVAKAISSSEPPTLPEEAAAAGQSVMPTLLQCSDWKRDINPRYAAQAAWAQVTGDANTVRYLYASGLECAGIEPTNSAGAISGAKLKTKPLQIQATRDPNTPYWNFQDMADAMQSHVLTVEGSGHVQMLTNNRTLDKIIAKYLRTGKVEETTIKGFDPKP